MSLSKTFNRPKLATTLITTIPLVANVFEVSNSFVVDITTTQTNDAGTSVTKEICRYVITPTIEGNNITFTATPYVFNATEANWATGGSTPLTSTGSLGNIQNLNLFLTNLGIANKNT